MAESTLSLIYADFVREVERYLRIATGTETTWVDDLLRTGCRKVYAAHDWKYLRVTTTLSTVAPYSTGTITCVDGVVTLSGGTFPTGAADYVLIANNITYEINTRDSGTQVTLEDLSVDIDAGTTYEVAKFAYDLPDGYGELLGPMTYHPGLNEMYRPLWKIDAIDLRVLRQMGDETDPPQCFAVRPKAFTATTGERYQVLFAPLPDGVYQFTYAYRVHPDKLATSLYPMGGMVHAETFRLAILAACELSRTDQAGPYEQAFQMQLAISIQRDSEMHAPDWLGRMLDPCEYDIDDRSELPRVDRGSAYPPYTD